MTGRKGFLVVVLLSGMLFGILAGGFFSLVHDLPQINDLKQFKPAAVTEVYSSDRQLLVQFFIEKRFPVSLEKVPENLINALLTIEDRTFYKHPGLHFKSIGRAIVHDLLAGKFKQGASTLTQQLAKTLFLTTEKSIVRKIKEAILALQIERRYTKNEILELYLNLIYLGSGSYGVEAASQTYFDKNVEDLSLAQAALIAGLPKAPSVYSPLKNPDLAKERRDIVLLQMLKTHNISPEQYEAAVTEDLHLPAKKTISGESGYFIEYVKSVLNKQFNLAQIYSGGLAVHTTLNFDYQHTAVQAVTRHMDELATRIQKRGGNPEKTQCAVIAMETKTGRILAMVGGKDFNASPFNRAVQAKRQPGSAFKPFVYAAALAFDFSQNDTILDGPLAYRISKNRIWNVENFSETYSGQMTLRKALALSKNTPAVRLLEKIGPKPVIALARKAGISSKLSPTLSLALGTYEVSLLELTAAYIPFANQGIRTRPFAIAKITDSQSRVIFEHTVEKTSIMSRQDAAIVTDMLKAVIQEGTGKKALTITGDIAGKTGTTDRFKDALFIGYSPGIVLGVWVGNDDSQPLGRNETGARAALPIWIDCMKHFLSTRPYQYFDIPDRTKMVYMNPGTGEITNTRLPGSVKALIKQ